jgi:hypothetical protein
MKWVTKLATKKEKVFNPFGKETQSINFDSVVLKALKEKADRENSKVSNLVNMICRQTVLKDESFFKEMAKHHLMKFHEFNYLKAQARGDE